MKFNSCADVPEIQYKDYGHTGRGVMMRTAEFSVLWSPYKQIR